MNANKRITVELSDLDWEDRETVLRLLFSKMNTGEPASCWRDPVGTGSSQQHKSESGTSSGQRGAGYQNLNQAFREEGADDNGMMYYDEEAESQQQQQE